MPNPIRIVQLCYVRLGTDDLEASARFATEIVGLQRGEGRGGDVVFRSDARAHTLALSTERGASLGVELEDEAALEAAAGALEQTGYGCREASAAECERRFVRRALICAIGEGLAVDLVLRPAVSGRRYFGSRDAAITGLACVGLRSTDLARDTALWTALLGAAVSDRAGEVTYLGFDDAHHRIVLYPAARPGIVYVTYAVESFDAVMQSHYFLQEHQVRVLHGPGREAASGQVFVRFQGPGGQIFAYGYGMATIDGGRHRARQFAAEPGSLCAWGSTSEVPELAGAAG
ncbi:VOC family protein [Chelatococcus reniformis]|nr:VOC family protein [Chelatococcus reniformis]